MFNPLKLHILIILALACYAQLPGDHSQDICASHQTYPTSATVLTANTPQTMTSSNCVEIFSVDLSNSAFRNNYVLIEIRLSLPNPNNISYVPILFGKNGTVPGIDTIGNYKRGNNPDYVDWSGYKNTKAYQYISLTKDDTKNGGMYYIALYRTTNISDTGYFDGPVQFKVQALSSGSFQCPNGCAGHGSCQPEEQQCRCNPNYFDDDCSIFANPMVVSGNNSVDVAPRAWIYYYMTLSDQGKEMNLIFDAEGGQVNAAYTILGSSQYYLPSVSYVQAWTLTDDDSTLSVSVSKSAQQTYSGNNLIYGFQNVEKQNTVTVTYTASLEKDSTSTVMIVIIVILAVLIILTAIIAMIKLRTMRRLREQYLQNQRNIAASTPTFLTIEEINQHFPLKEYGRIENHFQNSCSICLEEYLPQTVCRQLYCGHVFHGNCIEEWLKKHEKCPNCNKVMTAQAITEYKNNPNAISESPSPIQPNSGQNAYIMQQQPQAQPQFQHPSQREMQILQPQRRSVDLEPVVVQVRSETNLDNAGRHVEYAPPQYSGDYYANQMPIQQNGVNRPSDAEMAYRNDINNGNGV